MSADKMYRYIFEGDGYYRNKTTIASHEFKGFSLISGSVTTFRRSVSKNNPPSSTNTTRTCRPACRSSVHNTRFVCGRDRCGTYEHGHASVIKGIIRVLSSCWRIYMAEHVREGIRIRHTERFQSICRICQKIRNYYKHTAVGHS